MAVENGALPPLAPPAEGESEEAKLGRLEAEYLARQEAVTLQGDTVRALKAAKVSKDEITAAVEKLKELRVTLEEASKAYEAARPDSSSKSASREAFRLQVGNALERRLFFMPSYKIYGGVAGLYDYGPPGCAVKSNVLGFWRQHFVLEESMLEIECPSVTPEIVLRASGHVDKFTDLMVNDVVTKTCYRADHLLKEQIEKVLAEPGTTKENREELLNDLAHVDEYTAEELGAMLTKYGVKAPETKNDLSAPYPFNLMFATSIGPTGLLKGFMRPETAQGIFVNFRDLLYYNGGKLPFAAAQIGQAFRNEISPKAGLLRVREFTLAEIEHFVHPDNKEHPKFPAVAELQILLYGRTQQLGPKKPDLLRLGDAVASKTIANETLGYFIGRTYLFLTRIGVDPKRLRFRQHLQHEMAHYAEDCWDAEIESSYGWIECVGLADRSAYDLKAHTTMSKVELEAYERYPAPREVEELLIAPNNKELGKTFKKDAKVLAESLLAMGEEEALKLQADLTEKGTAEYQVCGVATPFTLTKEMVTVKKEKKLQAGRNFTPSVIEPSFGIGRIIYCMYEHCFYSRDGDENRTVFKFTPLVAPIKCSIFPLLQDKNFEPPAKRVELELTAAGLSSKVDNTGNTIGKRYARTDEIGIPFAVTVDHRTLQDDTVTLRERDTCVQVRIPISEVARIVRRLCDSVMSWQDVQAQFPIQESKDAE